MDDQLRKKAKEVPAVKTPSTVEESKESVEMFYRVKLEAVKQNYIDYLESNFANKAKMLETALSQHLTKFEQQLIDMNQHQVDANKQEDEREVLKLEKEVEALTKKKNELLAKVSIRQAELKAKKENASKQIDELLLKHKDEILSNVAECNYYNELLFNKSKIEKSVVKLSLSAENECARCKGNTEGMFKCSDCGKQSCIETCASTCQGENCQNGGVLLCSCQVSPCGLCRKVRYCLDCVKKCFYSECNNVFCPPCFKTNSHQLRLKNKACNFFKCPNDDKSVCILTTAFCKKCNKRLCNDCVFNDQPDHMTEITN